MKKVPIPLFLAFLFIGIFIYTSIIVPKGKPVVSNNILSLTEPVTSFYGKVEKKTGNTIFVTQSISGLKTPLKYQVNVNEETQILRRIPPIDYVFKNFETTVPKKPTINDILVGQNITVETETDLRTNTNNTVSATIIALPQVLNKLSGIITAVDGDIVTIEGRALGSLPKEPKLPIKVYQVKVLLDTEISNVIVTRNDHGIVLDRIAKKYSLSDLKAGVPVLLYTDQDITFEKKLTALRIAPDIQP